MTTQEGVSERQWMEARCPLQADEKACTR